MKLKGLGRGLSKVRAFRKKLYRLPLRFIHRIYKLKNKNYEQKSSS